MDTRLQDFVAHARGKGMDHATIRLLLLSAGWREKDVLQALTSESLDMPLPLPADRGGAREAFFHLLSFASLYITVISLSILFFTYINYYFRDLATDIYFDTTSYSGTIHWSMAAIIVTFPLFLWISRLLIKEMRHSPEKAGSLIRRWLTYLTLFVAAMAMVGDVITLLFNLLQGELSTRFLLKVLVVFALAGVSFSYYFLSLKMPPEKAHKKSFHSTYAIIAAVAVLAAIVWGFVLTGTPTSERARRFDERRISDFQTITYVISDIVYQGNQWATDRAIKNPIPTTLEQVSAQTRTQQIAVMDPETGVPYEYTKKDETHYQLCAVFNAERTIDYDLFWNHPAGRACFDFDITDPEGKDIKPVPAEVL